MKTGIVMQIEDGRATILQPGGVFRTVPVQAGWRQGDLVALPAQRLQARRWIAIAASLLLIFGALGSYGYVNTAEALVSIDIRPSIELVINRMGRVKQAVAYNAEGEALLSELSLRGQTYEDAMTTLMASDAVQGALAAGEYLDISVHAPGGMEQALLETTEESLEGVRQTYPEARTSCHRVEGDLVEQAHTQGMTPGRYRLFLELQSIEPDLDVADFSDCSAGDMHHQLRKRQRNGQDGGRHHGGE
ncbi:hypothetical protein LJC74_04580 [Eubacteriales bacterium OttesenSCG-928-A19]|nr:hypothetical protein [Eubacteriales bacterium OttesenSCG-928-A19]